MEIEIRACSPPPPIKVRITEQNTLTGMVMIFKKCKIVNIGKDVKLEAECIGGEVLTV